MATLPVVTDADSVITASHYKSFFSDNMDNCLLESQGMCKLYERECSDGLLLLDLYTWKSN